MKAEFKVTIEGKWFVGDKLITKGSVIKDVRHAIKEEFEFLAKRVSVKPIKDESTVFMCLWIFERGGFDQDSGVIGLYKSKELAKIAGDKFINERAYPSSYEYEIEEMKVNG